jgi:membrane protein DedA with SNARE-associated domain
VDQFALRIIDFVSQQEGLVGYSILALSALIEYVFPPFPGDTITLFGAFLITAKGWSFAAVFLAVLAGSAAGAYADFRFGRWLKSREVKGKHKHPDAEAKLDRLIARFEKHGEAYIVLNRFLPGVRALFFIAAGMAGMRPRWVVLWAVVSAALWNLMIIAIGTSLGANFEDLLKFFHTYSRWTWLILGGLALAFLVRAVVRAVLARLARP